MGKALQSDIASGFFSSWSFDLRKEWFTGKIIPVSSEIFTKWLRHIKLKLSFLFSTKFLKEYDTIIFSGDCISAVRNCKKQAKKIYYCHTPPRYIYDLHSLYLAKVPFYLRPLFRFGCFVFRFLYERDLSKMDVILTNSKNTQKRIKEYIGYESTVLYPPVDTEKFTYISDGDYFLSFARLADAKRVDKIVEAFKQMPDQKLLVIYWKNDPQRDKIFSLAAWHDNIQLITLEDNDLLYEYVGKCRATVYIPIDEDFGMSPVESMSAGKPVLWVNDGGLKETIIHKQTGYLIGKDANVEEIVEAVWYMTQENCREMKESCEQRAQGFSLESFEKKLKNLV